MACPLAMALIKDKGVSKPRTLGGGRKGERVGATSCSGRSTELYELQQATLSKSLTDPGPLRASLGARGNYAHSRGPLQAAF